METGMTRWVLLAAVILGGGSAAHRSTDFDGLERLRWLAGCWEQKNGDRTTVEMWMPPAAGLMLGAARTVRGERVVEFEQVRLQLEGNQLIYTALPSGQSPASFTASGFDESGFSVENPAHDFPQRIIYRRHGADSLVARIEGPGTNGTKGFDYPMVRVSCEAR
jgi:hypothetical protein